MYRSLAARQRKTLANAIEGEHGEGVCIVKAIIAHIHNKRHGGQVSRVLLSPLCQIFAVHDTVATTDIIRRQQTN